MAAQGRRGPGDHLDPAPPFMAQRLSRCADSPVSYMEWY
jgi:hypothetical protein